MCNKKSVNAMLKVTIKSLKISTEIAKTKIFQSHKICEKSITAEKVLFGPTLSLADVSFFKVDDETIRTIREIYLKLTINTPERHLATCFLYH